MLGVLIKADGGYLLQEFLMQDIDIFYFIKMEGVLMSEGID